MKQRKTSSTIGVLIIVSIFAIFATSCGKVPSKFIGSYTGTWKVADFNVDGTWTASVDKEGIITMEFKSASYDNVTAKGTVEKSGDITASGSNKDGSLTLTGKLKDKKLSGTAKLKQKGGQASADGTFEGKKKLFPILGFNPLCFTPVQKRLADRQGGCGAPLRSALD